MPSRRSHAGHRAVPQRDAGAEDGVGTEPGGRHRQQAGTTGRTEHVGRRPEHRHPRRDGGDDAAGQRPQPHLARVPAVEHRAQEHGRQAEQAERRRSAEHRLRERRGAEADGRRGQRQGDAAAVPAEQEQGRDGEVEEQLEGERPVQAQRVRCPDRQLQHRRVGQPVAGRERLLGHVPAGRHQQCRPGQAEPVQRVEPEHAADPEGAQCRRAAGRAAAALEARRDDEAAAEEEDHHAELAQLDRGRRQPLDGGDGELADVLQQHQGDRDPAQAVEEVQPSRRRPGARPHRECSHRHPTRLRAPPARPPADRPAPLRN